MKLFNRLYLIITLFLLGFLIFNEPFFSIQKSIVIFSQVSFMLLIFQMIIKKKIFIPLAISIPFVLFIIWALISIFFSLNKEDSIWEVLRLVSFFAFFISFYNFVKEDKENISKFLKWVLILFMVVVIDDLFFLIYGGGLIRGSYFEGALAWHNQMGGFLLFVIPSLLAFFISAKRLRWKFLLGIFIVTALIALILTYSRGAWLSFILSLSLFSPLLLEYIKRHVRAFAFTGIILFSIIGFFINPGSIIQKALTIQGDMFASTRSVSGSLRTTVWSNSLKMVEKSPFVGIGPGAFGSVYDNFQKDPWLYSKYPHNYFLEIAAETGIPGLLFFLGILAVAACSVVLNSRLKNPLYLGILLSLTASFFHAFLDVDFSRITLFLLFWIFMAMILAVAVKKDIVIKIEGTKKLIYLLPILGMTISMVLALGEQRYQKAQKHFFNLEFSEAEKYIKKSLSFNPYSEKSYYLLGNIQEKQNKLNEAKTSYKKGLFYFPSSSKFYTRFGTLALNSGDYKEAERAYRKAVNFAPYADLNAYLGLAQTYAKTKDQEKQQRIIDDAVFKAFPFNEAFLGFEYLYEASGKKDKLTDAYIKFIVMEINLRKPEKALKIIEITKKYLDPKNSSLPFLEENVVK